MDWAGERLAKGREQEMEDEKSLTLRYRAVFFGSPYGPMVLDDILKECFFWTLNEIDNPAQTALNNLGKMIMAKLGVWDTGNTGDILKALANIIPKEG